MHLIPVLFVFIMSCSPSDVNDQRALIRQAKSERVAIKPSGLEKTADSEKRSESSKIDGQQPPPTDDFPDNSETTGVVKLNGPAAVGTIDQVGDIDWFQILLAAHKNYRVTVKNLQEEDGFSPSIEGIYDNAGNKFVSGSNAYITFASGAAGSYYIATSAGSRSTDLTGEYGVSIDQANASITQTTPTKVPTQGPHQEQPESTQTTAASRTNSTTSATTSTTTSPTTSTTTSTTGPSSESAPAPDAGFQENINTAVMMQLAKPMQSGSIESAQDNDWYKIRLEKDVSYQIDMEGVFTKKGTLMNPYINGVYEATRTQAFANTSNDNIANSFNARIVFTPKETKNYYLSVGSSAGSKGTYELLAAVWDPQLREGDDAQSNIYTQQSISIGQTLTSYEFDDELDDDWFEAVNLEANHTYKFYLGSGYKHEGFSVYNADFIGIFNENGDPIETRHHSGEYFDNFIDFTPAKAGKYFVGVQPANHKFAGTYFLSLIEDDFRSDTDTRGRITSGNTLKGKIEADYDIDWIGVHLEASKTYQIDVMKSESSGSMQDPLLKAIYDRQGKMISETRVAGHNKGDGVNDRIAFNPTTTGLYYIGIAGGKGDTGNYDVALQAL